MRNRLSAIDKKSEILIVVLSLAFSFTVWFFTPVELFLSNQKDFIVNSPQIVFPMLIASAVIAAGCILILNLLLMFWKSLYMVSSRMLFGVLLAFYVQELFFNGDMNLLTGDAEMLDTIVPWKKYLNAGLMYLIAVLPMFLSLKGMHKPEKKLFQLGNGYIIPYVSAIIVVMQAVGFGTTAATYTFDQFTRVPGKLFSCAPMVSLSPENNVIVFLMDRFDGEYLDNMLENYPELHEEFSGFTFYRNNISHYTNTFPSVTQMLTQELFDGGTWDAYFESAWADETILDRLKQNGYHINLILDNPTTFGDPMQLDGRCDNLLSEEELYAYNYLGENGIIPTMSSLSLGVLSPYVLKPSFLGGITSDFSASFVLLNDSPDLLPAAIGEDSDLKFYNYIKEHPLTADGEKNFTFAHLGGCHDILYEVEDIYEGEFRGGSFDTANTARAELEILFAYFDQMKAAGVFEQSTIIIVGDHGRPPDSNDYLYTELDRPITTALLIKPVHSGDAPLKFDADPELTNDYLAASILEYAGIPHEDFGYSFRDVIEQDIHSVREIECMQWGGVGAIASVISYRVTGNARNFENWEPIEKKE